MIPKLRSEKTGLPPGSLIYIGSKVAQETTINLSIYNADTISTATSVTVEECVAQKSNLDGVLWIDVAGLREIKTIGALCQNFGLHSLVIEDILNTQQRPKMDLFSDYIFITIRAYLPNRETKRFTSQQISLILGKNFVITIREDSTNIFSVINSRLQVGQNIIRKKGADYLVHALIDVVVDGYFDIVEIMGDKIGILEEKVISNPDNTIVREIHTAKREIIYLRKSIWPLREVISGLQHRIDGLIDHETIFYLKDIYDHTIQIIDTIETYRDFLSGMLDVYLSSVSNKLSEVMKVLTMFASIFIPMTFITSLYGMNFDTSSPFNMPELHWRYGYLFVWGIVVVLIIGMMAFFKRKKWW